MGTCSRRFKVAAAVVGALTAAVLALGTSPAAASGTYSGLAYIHGAGSFTDDLGDEGILSTTTNTPSNAVCVWQEILWADGYLGTADIDGSFGPRTESATESWQSNHSLYPDGVVGKDTFGSADINLSFQSGSTAAGQYLDMVYEDNIEFTRNTDGNWGFWDFNAGGAHHLAGYNYRNC